MTRPLVVDQTAAEWRSLAELKQVNRIGGVVRAPMYTLTAEEATLLERAAQPAHVCEVSFEAWDTVYAEGTHTVTSRVCVQRCLCGAMRHVVWPPVSPGCQPVGIGPWWRS